ncbi:ABC transporter ATP-binding protein [Microcella sp.]|uniref:ABC transporter ATP-binding protein n=1 Tax=Microcella sp. TaxID=1913979 RepID=UPI002568BD8F|nr:ATP-binding cassette domain-containing protein [Microcella sp.]MBX9472374.1 ATP-binding cassette domain-containing protein [Microcella sp.]
MKDESLGLSETDVQAAVTDKSVAAAAVIENGALEVRGLGVKYGGFVALDDVSWSVAPGEILGIIGPNGAGKSTCMAAITNSVKHVGAVLLDGQDVTGVPTDRLSRLGLRRTFQQNAFYNELSVIENASSALLQHEGTPLWASVLLPRRETRQTRRRLAMAGELLTEFGVPSELFGNLPSEIPYGTQRMLSVALAFGSGAKALLVDEPAAGVGGSDMRDLAETLQRIAKTGTALVVIEHHMDLIMSVADRIVVLDRGAMLAAGTPHEIRTNEKVLEAYLGRAA